MSAKIESRNRSDQRRVLVVDDQAGIRELLGMTLEDVIQKSILGMRDVHEALGM